MIMDSLSPYERQRLKNIEENKKVLASLGLLKGPSLLPRCPPEQKTEKKKQGVKRKRTDYEVTAKPKISREDSHNIVIQLTNSDYIGYMTRRQSKRLLGKEPEDFSGLDVELEEFDDRPKRVTPRYRENVFGQIPDIPVGTVWSTRLDCSHDGVHSLLPRCPPEQKTEKKKQGVKRKRTDYEVTAKPKISREDSHNIVIQLTNSDYIGYMTRRQSKRLLGKEPEDFSGLDVELEEFDDRPKRVTPRYRENVFGQIPDIPVGTVWSTRLDCSHDGVHRPTVAGIHGNEVTGCYSLALSGGYEDDLDYGVCFTYTGEGGRDLKGTKSNPKNLRTAPQSKDQSLTRGNLALSKNVENGHPIRVIRGYKLRSSFAPEEGYRYDGLYTVERFWQTIGLSGFMVYKFALRRCSDQAPPPWEQEEESEVEANKTEGCNEQLAERLETGNTETLIESA